MLKKIPFYIFNILASLKLAVFTLSSLALSLAVGTFIESAQGALAAKLVVYDHVWFSLLLILLFLNVSCSALNRIPWQRKHIGFLLTHSGILMIILGSWITREKMIDGEIALTEGESSQRVTLHTPLLQIYLPHSEQGATLEMPRKAFRWEGRQEIKLPEFLGLKAYLTAYYPHAKAYEEFVPDAAGKPGVEVGIFNQRMRTGSRLLLGDPALETAALGPANVHISAKTFAEEQTSADPVGELYLTKDGETFSAPVSEALKDFVPLGNTGYEIKVSRYLPHAVVENNELINKSEQAANPACEVLLRGNGLEEAHTVFANFPDFPTLHGLGESKSGFSPRFHFKGTDTVNELRLIPRGKELLYQIKTGDKITEPEAAEPEKNYPLGWTDLQFMVLKYQPAVKLARGYRSRPVPMQKSAIPAARIEFEKNGQRHETWIFQGGSDLFFLGDMPYRVTSGFRTVPLSFAITLKDFMIEHYPGTERAASFKSQVKLQDEEKGVLQDTLISMNEPLEYQGYKIYQSGYQLGENGGPDISIFAAGKDPGISLKYFGCIIMILGIIVMFYMKKFLNKKPSAAVIP